MNIWRQENLHVLRCGKGARDYKIHYPICRTKHGVGRTTTDKATPVKVALKMLCYEEGCHTSQ